MPVANIARAVLMDDLAVKISVWRWTCDRCGYAAAFHDDPMPLGASEFDAQTRGWRILWGPGYEGNGCHCPGCVALASPAERSNPEN